MMTIRRGVRGRAVRVMKQQTADRGGERNRGTGAPSVAETARRAVGPVDRDDDNCDRRRCRRTATGYEQTAVGGAFN